MTRWIRHDAWSDLLELALVAAFGVVLAFWTWPVIAPRPVAAPGLLDGVAVARSTAQIGQDLFGVSRGELRAVEPSRTSLALLGVLSGPDANGRAILSGPGGRPVIAAAGEDVFDGVVLQEVHPDHVIVLRQGAPERIELRQPGPHAPPPAPPRASVHRR